MLIDSFSLFSIVKKVSKKLKKMDGTVAENQEEYDASSFFFMLRSTPPGTFPIKIKPGFSVGIIAFSLIALFVINGVFYMLQDRVLDDVAPLSEMAVGKYNSLVTAFVCGSCGFLFSLISTVIISYIELVTRTSKKIIYVCRFFNIFISLFFILIGTVLYCDSYTASFCLKGMFFAASIFYSFLVIITLAREIPLYLTILRSVFLLIALVGFFIMIKVKPFGNYSIGSTRAIGEYILTFSLLIELLTMGKELSDVFIDIVVISDVKQ